MDVSWSSSPLLLLTLSIPLLLLLLKHYNLYPTRSSKAKLPPCPYPRTFLTALYVFLRRPSFLDFIPLLRRLRAQHGPILAFSFPSFPTVYVLDRRLAHEALVLGGAAFSDRPLPGPAEAVYSTRAHNISSARGTLWRLLRRNLASGIANPSRLRSFSPARRRALASLLRDLRSQSLSGDGVVLLLPAFRRALHRLLAQMCFGDDLADAAAEKIDKAQRDLLDIALDLVWYDSMPLPGKILMRGTWRKLLSIRRRQEEIMLPLISARRTTGNEKPVPCYVDTLLDLHLPEENRKLTDTEIVALCSEFLNGGVDTTAATVEWAIANLVKHPRVQRRLYEEIAGVVPEERGEIEEEDLQGMPYLRAVVLETLRRHPPAQLLLPHAAADDARLGGYEIPKGAVVNFPVTEVGWDAEVWEEPMEFRPERFVKGGEGEGVDVTGSREIRMMPFGAGRRICPGLGVGMLHLQYYLASLVREFEWKTSGEGEEVDLSERVVFSTVMKRTLRARVLPRRR